jgi:pSer/pThr/pTyr-binding forkhead associated (FHA) protein
MAKVYLMLKDTVLAEIPLEKTVVSVGRAASNDIPIDNLAVSGFHARIVCDNGVYLVEDLNSTNGTFVNDRRIAQLALNNNDVIMVGKHTLVFSDPREGGGDPDVTQNVRTRASEATVLMDSRLLAVEPTPSVATRRPEVPLGSFTVIEGPVEQKEYLLTERLTSIGKSETAEIRLKGFFAPRIAALVNRGADGYSISPPGNGRQVLVNGVPIAGRIILKPCDLVEFWKVKLQFFLQE